MRAFDTKSLLPPALGILLQLFVAPAASACGSEVRVTFTEASPDNFVIEFLRGREGQLAAVSIDLSASLGQAYVDTLYGADKSHAGSGVELAAITGFAPGTQAGVMAFKAFAPGHSFKLLVDLDDRAGGGDYDRNVLTTNELEGGKVTVEIRNEAGQSTRHTGTFNAHGIARIGNHACV